MELKLEEALLNLVVWDISKIIRQCSIYLTSEPLMCKQSTAALVTALAIVGLRFLLHMCMCKAGLSNRLLCQSLCHFVL